MALTAFVGDGSWSVSVKTESISGPGYQATIHVRHAMPDGTFERSFRHARVFASESDAALEGLREGMTWIALKTAQTISV